MSEKIKWAFLPGALEHHFGPICSLAPDESADLFFSLGSKPRKLWPFESTPGHPSYRLNRYDFLVRELIFESYVWRISTTNV